MEESIKTFLFNPVIGKISTIIIGLILIWILIKTLQRNVISKLKDSNNRYKTKKTSTIIGYILTIILITIVYSDKLGGVTIALGVAGAGIAFALQEVITSFAGWLAIIFGGFYKTGDRVQVGGIKGDVMDIGVLRTTIMEIGQWIDGDLYNGRIVLISNSFVFKEPVFNYSGEYPFLWDEIKIPIQFGSNYDKTMDIFYQTAKNVAGNLSEKSQQKWNILQQKYLLENAQTEPLISMTANNNWVEYTIRYVVNFKKRRTTKTELFKQIIIEIEKTNGEIKFPTTTFQLVQESDLQIKLINDEYSNK